MKSTAAGWHVTVATESSARNAGGWAPLQMLDGTDGQARLVFESGTGRRQTARLDRWLAVIRLQQPTECAARVVWLLDARTVQRSGGLPPGDLYRGVTGLNSEETPILWFRAGDGGGERRAFTASGVFGAAGIVDAARVRVTARRMRRQARLRMAVDTRMWGLSASPAASEDTAAAPAPELTIIATGAPRQLDFRAIGTWL